MLLRCATAPVAIAAVAWSSAMAAEPDKRAPGRDYLAELSTCTRVTTRTSLLRDQLT